MNTRNNGRPVNYRWIVFLLAAVGTGNQLAAQTPGEWTWMHGDNTSGFGSLGVFGTQGVPSPTNKPPGLYEPCEWADHNGNFWLLGGSSALAPSWIETALWKYDPGTNQWTWMKGPPTVHQPGVYGTQGIPSSANYPGSRGFGSATWVDAIGNLWLFGGGGQDVNGGNNGNLNDLWKYDISTNEWTWMKGSNIINDPGSYGTQGVSSPTNCPPSRGETTCYWTDKGGNLWLFGGYGQNAAFKYNDLWKYDVSTNEWTWLNGANTPNQPPVYGTQGVATSANTPGGRMVYSSWTDLSGNLWLFGGGDYNGVGYNDLWKYDVSSNQWTWIKGPNTTNDPGNYGTKCVSTNTSTPPSRLENRARVRDACGNFWFFGGGMDTNLLMAFNDLWHYNVSTSQWTWASGDNILSQAAVYGTKGVSNPANKPGAKIGSVAWIDNNGYIWVFGGVIWQPLKFYNDLFRYVPDPACVPVGSILTTSSNTSICIGQSATLTVSGGTSYSWSPGGQSTSSIVVSPANSTTYVVTGNNGCGFSTSTVTVTVYSVPSITASSSTTICSGQSAILTASGGNNYSWSPGGQTTTSITVSPITSTSYTVTENNACGSDSASVTVTVNNSPTATATSTNVSCIGGNDGIATVAAAAGSPPYNYLWTPTGGTGPTASGLSAGTYTATVMDANGCNSTQTVAIGPPANAEEFYLPNAFSPNHDGENDEFCLQAGMEHCITELEIIIYDRWGEKVFESDNKKTCWDGTYDGKRMNTAVFVYYLEVTLISGKEIIKKGNISLIR